MSMSENVLPQTTGESIYVVEVFCSYAHKDESLKKELDAHLKAMEREGLIAIWSDRRIDPGMEWEGEIDEHLESAEIILLLISSDFIASDYCYKKELNRALERHRNGEARVIPVILRPVDWTGMPFGAIQALPKNGKAVTSWRNRDESYVDITLGIRKVVEQLRQERLQVEGSDQIYWEVSLHGRINDLDRPHVEIILNTLRGYVGNSQLRLQKVTTGSIVCLFAGSREGFRIIRSKVESKELTTLAGFQIEAIKLTPIGGDLGGYKTNSQGKRSLVHKGNREEMTTMFIPDTAISSAKEDRLGRTEFGHRLGNRIRDWNREESIVIALYGSWGSGKTSLVNMAAEHIQESTKDWEKDKRPIIVRFNPWNFAEQSDLLQSFFQQLFAQIGKHVPNREREFRNAINKFAKTLAALEGLPTIGGVLAAVAKTKEIVVPQETLEDLKSSLDKLFRDLDRRILILVDDIDRLTQQEIRQLFQLIKVNADFANTIYLVAFDRGVVEKALTTEQGILGHEYLEKIVQVGFDVPPIDRPYIEEYLLTELDKVLQESLEGKWDTVRWGNLYHAGFKRLFTTLRDVKRFINGLAFNFGVVAHEVNPIDFIGIEAIRIFIPKVYTAISQDKGLFAETQSPWSTRVDQSKLREQYESIFALAGERRDVAKSICQQLFPEMKTAYENTFFGPEWQSTWRKERRICATDVFDVYFLLGTPKGDVSQSELKEIAAIASEPEKVLSIFQKMVTERRIIRLLTLLDDIIDELAEPGIDGLCQALFVLCDGLADLEYSTFFGSPDWQIARLVYKGLQKLDEQKRCQWLEERILSGPAIFAPIQQIALDEPRENKTRENPLFGETCIDNLKKACVRMLADRAKSDNLLSAKNLPYLLFRWREWDPDQKSLEEFIEHVTSNPETALDFLVSFMRPIESHTFGDYVPRSKQKIRLKEVGEFIDSQKLDSVLAHVTEHVAVTKSERHGMALRVFRAALERRNKDLPEDEF